MMSLLRKLLRGSAAGLIAISPMIIGIFPSFANDRKLIAALLFVAVTIVIGELIPVRRRILLMYQLTIAGLAVALTASSLDLLARPIYNRPVRSLPRVARTDTSLIYRFPPNRSYTIVADGNLADLVDDPPQEFRSITFQSDRYGYRNADSDPESIGLIVLGDSFGAGTGISQELTFASLLAEATQEPVYNLSVDAASPWQEYMTLALELDRMDIEPDTVVIWLLFSGNDYTGSYYPIYDPQDLEERGLLQKAADQLISFRRRSVIAQAINRINEYNNRNTAAKAYPFLDDDRMVFYTQYQTTLSDEEIRQADHYEMFIQTLSAMSDFSRAHDLTVIAVLAPSKAEVYRWVWTGEAPWSTRYIQSPFSAMLEEQFASHDLCYLDLTSTFIEQARTLYEQEGALLWWRDDTHWNANGHALAAQTILDESCLNGPSLCCDP